MAIKVIMPQLGESVVEGTVTHWLHQEGEPIHEFESLLEINTDKVDTEIPSPGEGTLLKILVPEGETVRAGTVIAWIGAKGEPIPGLAQGIPAGEPHSETQTTAAAATAGRSSDLGFISPIVARLARDENVELSQVKPTGSGGRITKKDVLDYVAAREESQGSGQKEAGSVKQVEQEVQAAWETPADGDLFRPSEMVFATPPGAGVKPARQEGAPASPGDGQDAQAAPGGEGLPENERVVPLSPVRKATAEHMLRSVRTSPHVTTVMEADLSKVVAHRKMHKADYAQRGVRLTFTTYFIAAAIEALKAYPLVNSSWSDEGIRIHPVIHIGMATSLGDEGLIVPVIKGADGLSLIGLARKINDLADRARSRRLAPEEVQNGTFTVTNHGVSGSLFAMPIINQPQCAILGIGAIQKRVVAVEDAIAIRPMAYLSLTFDHRILDGVIADHFLTKVVATLEEWRDR